MNGLKKYTSYKDSDVEWLGKIPEHWEVNKLKYISNVYNGATPSSGTERFWNGTISWVTPTDFNKSNYINNTERKITKSGLNSCGTTLVPKYSIIMTTRAPIGNIAIAENELCTNQGCKSIVVNKKNDEKYTFYQFFTKSELLNSLGSGTTFMELSSKELKNIKIPLPPKEEQIKIASFLDEKTAQIDEVISQKEKLIELLKERKQIVINDAVTKGLNKNVEFVDSGVEWIGQIPKHWEISKVKNIFKLIIEPAPKANEEELLSIYTDIGVRPRKELAEKGNKASTTDGYWRVKKGDFIVNKLLAWMGAIGLSEYDGVTSPAYDILRAKKDIVGIYYHELFRLKIFSQEMKKYSRGIMDMRLRLYFDKFGDILIPYPSYDEQLQIVEYIENQTTKIDKAIELQQNYISKLKEYKSSLIDSVVTGKVRV
ncbi:restriction endonuclease subunit S [Aliarcobacter butzleri]|uniref:Restriction endonuclease subunit S n=1 Tax=Aliarcobacter butzleri TaxID=28197 RepID=A0AAW6VUL9_9BACT|nr:restriction endonuclease subunit S [Aliarcobacter butzleri]MDK2063238.1 restriction endonuclease subunit S [Aliarcobacter butzleri]